jgi:hypothetical protein
MCNNGRIFWIDLSLTQVSIPIISLSKKRRRGEIVIIVVLALSFFPQPLLDIVCPWFGKSDQRKAWYCLLVSILFFHLALSSSLATIVVVVATPLL